MKPLVSAIIVHWNTPGLLRKLLVHLSGGKDFQVVVVDNASQKPLLWVKKEFPNVTLIENKNNFGYAKACNQGARRAKGEWLLFLNPDVAMSSKHAFQIVKASQQQNFDASSPIPSSKNYQKPLPTWLSLLIEFSPLQRLVPLSLFQKKTLTGGCLLMRKETFKALHGWDEDFFLWFEDSDLTTRLLEHGYRIGWVDIPVKHAGGAAFAQLDERKKRKLFFDSMSHYAKKHFSPFGRLVVWLLKARHTL